MWEQLKDVHNKNVSNYIEAKKQLSELRFDNPRYLDRLTSVIFAAQNLIDSGSALLKQYNPEQYKTVENLFAKNLSYLEMTRLIEIFIDMRF